MSERILHRRDYSRVEPRCQCGLTWPCPDAGVDGALRRETSDAETKSLAGAQLAQIKHQRTSPRTRRRQCAQAAKAFWDRIPPQDRGRIMRLRRKKGMLRKKGIRVD